MAVRRKKRKVRKKFSKKMQKKLIIMFLFITTALLSLIGRLMYIEYTSGDKYEKIVLSQQGYDSKLIPFQRGDIIDSKGTVLATSVDVYNVVLDCKVLNQNKKQIDATLKALAACFPELSEADLNQVLKDERESRYSVLMKKVPYDTIQPFVEMQADSKNYPNISDAVWFEKEYERKYPYGSMAASLIGFTSDGNVGTVGLENYYNSTLNGINGREYGYLNSDNNMEKTVKNAENGKTIVSTIDTNIQSVVEEKLNQFNEEYRNKFVEADGSLHTAAIVMNPNNGEILAMANYPGFDLSNPRDLASYYTPEELEGLDEEQQMDLLNKLWQNFCITYTFEPGSTAKPFTIAAGLETGKLSGSESYYCDGVEDINGLEVHCVSRVGHGMITAQQSLMLSCNDALMQMSYVIGQEDFCYYQSIFGFGEKTNIDLPGEALTAGLLYQPENMTKLDLATNSFGQNFNCTMMQLASAFSSIVNGGSYYQPHVVKKILDDQGNTIKNIQPVLLKETVSKETSDTLKEYLYATVCDETGTGKTARVPGYSMGGKTGTAQKVPRTEGNYLVSFIGYVPQENPEIVIYVIVDQPNAASSQDQAHSTYAQNIVHDILTEILPYLNIYPDEEIPEDDAQQNDPDVQGGETGNAPDDQEAEDVSAGENTPETGGDAPESQKAQEGAENNTNPPQEEGGKGEEGMEE